MIDGIEGLTGLGSLLGVDKKKDEGQGGMFSTLLNGVGDADSETADAGLSTDGMSPATKDALDMLHEMTQGGFKGYFAWMVKKIREDVMDKMGVSEADLAKMSPQARAAMEKQIDEAVAQQVAKMMGIDPAKAQKMMADVQNVTPVDPTDPAAVAQAKKAYKDVPSIL